MESLSGFGVCETAEVKSQAKRWFLEPNKLVLQLLEQTRKDVTTSAAACFKGKCDGESAANANQNVLITKFDKDYANGPVREGEKGSGVGGDFQTNLD